ncbi:Gfo/Idh/MocA family oxidoreductase [Streptomyces antnestii]|uniref:Gfo/Idh/MocA family oxidoreductase n=1 Tax=Streptomyces antnestii TaxID=2494256 RepID=A0A3S2Z2U2_9ACTN|nr:Gfo/Idh/MocA family oxidoreductase [Streptomyces sp. San01]RVU27875.1 Gfo/Idh/MocA family oxidoreductase [Streptomyces sp. San01]
MVRTVPLGPAEPVTLVVAGAGMRGMIYARRAVLEGRARIVALAEPRADIREAAAAEFGIDPSRVFADWRELAAAGRLADAAVVATQDSMHTEPAVVFAELGYHLVLEKPMAPTEEESARIVAAAEKAGVMLAVCHVLRYTPYTRALKALIDSGRIGTIASIEHLEPVGWWHQAHSFVRGNWRSEAESSSMLLQKSCHDIDWLIHLMGQVPTRVASFGSLLHFRPENKPDGAADNCLDCGVEAGCPYSAKRIYTGFLDHPDTRHWPLSVVTTDHTEEGVLAALRTSPYGACVYSGGNDVVDHQVVTMEFATGGTVSFTMTAFTAADHRKTRIFGTHGSVEGDGVRLRVHDFTTDTVETIDTGSGEDGTAAAGHGGGDEMLLDAFVEAVRTGDRSLILTDARDSLASHQVVWAAERARKTARVVAL